MGLVALSANVNKTAAAGTDCCGQMLLVAARALVTSGKYRFAGMGDGLAATTTTPGTDIFTANGGLGYKTSGAWSTAAANSFSNALAWFRLQELDNEGATTGREFGVQRGSGTALGNDRFNVIAFSQAGWSGASSATSFFATGTYVSLYSVTTTTFGSAGVDITSTVTSSSPYLQGTGVLYYCTWTPDGESADDVQPFMIVWDGTGPDPGGAIVYEAVRCSSADTTPYCLGGGSCSQLFSESVSGVPSWFNTTNQPVHAYSSAGALTASSILRVVPPDGTTHPGSATAIQTEQGGTYPALPAFLWLDTAVSSQYKGELESLRHQFPLSASYMNRATFNADADSGDLTKPPLRSLGHLVAPWLLGVSLVETRGNFNTVRTAIEPTDPPDETAPELTSLVPASLSELEPLDTIDLVWEDDSGIATLTVLASYGTGSYARTDVVFAGTSDTGIFFAPYDGDVTSDATSLALDNIARDPGWPGAFTLTMIATDGAGNVTEETASYTVSEYLPSSEAAP